MKGCSHPLRRGFTLIELSVGIMVGMAVCAMVLALFNQQAAFLKIYKSQNFITEEAPVISNYVGRLVGRADRFRLHDNLSDALSNVRPRTTSSPVVVLNFRLPDGTVRASILSFANLGSGNALYYYVVPTSGVLSTPQWAITKKASNVAFSMSAGILQMKLTGPANEVITYSGSMQQ